MQAHTLAWDDVPNSTSVLRVVIMAFFDLKFLLKKDENAPLTLLYQFSLTPSYISYIMAKGCHKDEI